MRGEQVAVAEQVERRDERQQQEREAGGEERHARPRCVVGAAAAAEAEEAAGEAGGCDRGEGDRHGLEQPRRERTHVSVMLGPA